MRSFAAKWCLFLVFGAVFSAPAALVWQNTEQRRSVSVEQAETTFSFFFMNAGSEFVGILKIQKSCTCLKETLDKKIYAPGESGTLQVTFDLNDHEGVLKKSLMVVSSDQPDKPVRIGVEVNIPQGYRLSEQRLLWNATESASKTSRLVNPSGKSIPLVAAVCENGDFSVELIPVRDGFEYEVTVRPTVHGADAQAVISVFTAVPKDGSTPRKYSLYAVMGKGD
jgi:hypothetical protein